MHRFALPGILISALAVAAAWAPSVAVAATTQTCTIVAKASQRIVHGTNHRDVICARKGSHVILAMAGNDVIYTGIHGSIVHGGNGTDDIVSGSGKDTINGGPGNDTLTAKGGNDRIAGDAGNDLLQGGRGDDTLVGGAGNDTLEPGAGRNVCEGGSGNDRLGPWCDTYAPMIDELSLSTDTVDTSTSDQEIVFTLRITDGQAGFKSGMIRLDDDHNAEYAITDTNRISGDAHDGVYQVSVWLPQNSPQKNFAIDTWTEDNYGNTGAFPDWKLHSMGLPSVIRQVGAGDSKGPQTALGQPQPGLQDRHLTV